MAGQVLSPATLVAVQAQVLREAVLAAVQVLREAHPEVLVVRQTQQRRQASPAQNTSSS